MSSFLINILCKRRNKMKFENLINKLMSEAPVTAPEPTTKPAPTTTPSPTKPSTPNPSPFRRGKPGSMPEIKPKAGALEQEIKNIITKYAKFIGG